MLAILLFGAVALGLVSSFGGGGSDEDSLSYSEQDEEGNSTLIGWDDADSIVGGNQNDIIVGLGGDDTLIGGASNDRIHDGEGNDILRGYAGDDTLSGSESILSTEGATAVAGDDQLYGGVGNDLLVSTLGHDSLYGGSGDDTVDGWSTVDSPVDSALLVGGTGSDLIIGGPGDTLWGGNVDSPDTGVDRFAVVMDNSDAGAALIKDLDPDLERLFLFLPVASGETADPDKLVATTRDTSAGLEVVVDGEVIVVVEGVTVADNIDIRIRTLSV